MRGGLFWLIIGVFVGAYIVLDNTEAAAWFSNVFEMLKAHLSNL